jgi:Flp pilus assembly protein TadD
MKKVFLAMMGSAAMIAATAQSVSEGIKDLYYRKYKSAGDVLTKLATANPADVDANYWLGQLYIDQENLPLAQAQYAKAMTSTNQNPLIVVGMGHVELMQGKTDDARKHFDAAAAATANKKGGDPKILAAIGRAEADGDSKIGDPAYGLDKLATAAKLNLTDPEIMVNSGLLYLKKGGEFGGDAKSAFDAALQRDPKYALAKVRIAKIFQSQNNPDLFLPMFKEATMLDPNYGPAYLDLYNYYAERQVDSAKIYLDKYIAVSDKDCETDYFYADYLFRAGKYQESLDKGKQLEASCPSFPKVYVLYAYDYDRLGDSLSAKNNMEKYMQMQTPAQITGDNYAFMASLYGKFPGNEAKVEENIQKAIDQDSVVANKIAFITQMATKFGKDGNYAAQANWMAKIPRYKTTPLTETEIYYWGDAATKAKNYVMADSVYKNYYIAQFPDKVNGYSLRRTAAVAADADTSKGTAIEAIEGQTTFLKKDSVANKNRIINNYGYEVYYYAKIMDYQKGLDAANNILYLDPTNAYALGAKAQFEHLLNPAKKNPATEPKPKTPATKPKTK